jgi:hypothetical protein
MAKEYKYKDGDKVVVRYKEQVAEIVSVNDMFGLRLIFGGNSYDYIAEYKGNIVALNEKDIIGKVGDDPSDLKKYCTSVKVVAESQNEMYATSEEEAIAHHRTLLERWGTEDQLPEVYAPEIVCEFKAEEID